MLYLIVGEETYTPDCGNRQVHECDSNSMPAPPPKRPTCPPVIMPY